MTFNEWLQKYYEFSDGAWDDLTDEDYDALYAEYEMKQKNEEAEYLGILEEPDTEEHHGWYYYVQKLGDKLMAGCVTNTGFKPCIEVQYDEDESRDENLSRLYDAIVEAEYRI